MLSVTSLVRNSRVKKLFDGLLSQVPKVLDIPLKVPPLDSWNGGHFGLVGIAFDYLIRFELQRRCLHTRTEGRGWIAEGAAELLLSKIHLGISQPTSTSAWPCNSTIYEMARRYENIVSEAKSFLITHYLKDAVPESQPSFESRRTMAEHALRLARLDPYYRNGYLDPEPEKIELGDVDNLLKMLDIVPWADLCSPTMLWLNPILGSPRMGIAADADLISGDRLVDFKVTKSNKLREYMPQVLAYLILARARHVDRPEFPLVMTAGIYYARHGILWCMPESMFVEQQGFNQIEKRFFGLVDELNHRPTSTLEEGGPEARRSFQRPPRISYEVVNDAVLAAPAEPAVVLASEKISVISNPTDLIHNERNIVTYFECDFWTPFLERKSVWHNGRKYVVPVDYQCILLDTVDENRARDVGAMVVGLEDHSVAVYANTYGIEILHAHSRELLGKQQRQWIWSPIEISSGKALRKSPRRTSNVSRRPLRQSAFRKQLAKALRRLARLESAVRKQLVKAQLP